MNQQKVKELFGYKEGKLFWLVDRGRNKMIGKGAGTLTLDGYLQTSVDNVLYKNHRLIWLWHFGEWPSKGIDHIDGDPLNNNIGNLRNVTHKENGRNSKRGSNNTSGVSGVCFHKAKGNWCAYIHSDTGRQHLGYFSDWFEAVCVRKSAEVKHGYHKNHGRV